MRSLPLLAAVLFVVNPFDAYVVYGVGRRPLLHSPLSYVRIIRGFTACIMRGDDTLVVAFPSDTLLTARACVRMTAVALGWHVALDSFG